MPDSVIMDDYDQIAGSGDFDDFSQFVSPRDDLHAAPPPEGVIPLGYDRGIFYYLSQGNRQVVALSAASHSKTALMSIASATHYWQRSRFNGERGIKWDDAIDWLMTECRAVGIFDPDRLRGRGAWVDNNRSVLHAGDRLIVGGVALPLELHGSRYVYEAARSIGAVDAAPLSNADAHRLVKICQSLRWEIGISGMLMAGFIAVAPICGGLAWRPSCWITGGSGSGKTWVNENIISPALAGIALQVQSKTSEAGIRQLLGSDARPVIFDEFESEDSASAARVQGVLDLVRQASSETGGAIVKGSQTQSGAKTYRVRSSFWFSSINVGIEHQADDSRITVLALRTAPAVQSKADAEHFNALNAEVQRTITPEFAAGLLARSVKLLPVIRANAETFAVAVALHLGSRRLGDQIGTLLAGAYSLHSDGLITPTQAEEFVRRQDWECGGSSGDVERDEHKMLTHLTQSRVKIALGNSAPVEITLARLVAASWGGDERISADAAQSELLAMGMRPDANQGLFVSNTHPAIKRLMIGTPWAANWNRALSRLPGAEHSGKAIRFGMMHQSRAVYVPRKTLEGDA